MTNDPELTDRELASFIASKFRITETPDDDRFLVFTDPESGVRVTWGQVLAEVFPGRVFAAGEPALPVVYRALRKRA